MWIEKPPREQLYISAWKIPASASSSGWAASRTKHYVFFANAASTLAEDLEQQIIEFAKDHPDIVLIFIDTFQMIRASNGTILWAVC